MSADSRSSPSWERLYETAASQGGLFTGKQAADAGYSHQLIAHHLRAGRILRVKRSVYRLVHFPAGDHEDLTAVWLWSDHEGVFSHQTALALHDLSDILPARVHVTLPESWRKRRLRVPEGVVLHYGHVAETERQWFGPIPATAPRRTLWDCVADHLPPDLLRAAALDALRRRLVAPEDLGPVEEALAGFGGLGR